MRGGGSRCLGALGVMIAAMVGGLPSQVGACQICFPIPKASAADYLLAADRVVLARENPDKPFSLKAIEVLKGDAGSPEIDLFLDSNTRRVLAAYPERTVVCVHRVSGPEAGWMRVGMTNEIFGPLVREILDRSSRWKEAPKERLAFFAKLLGDENGEIRQIAHIEVARAPYNEIRALGGILPREEIHAFLANFRYVEWHALYILLLAQSGNELDRPLIADKVRSAERFSSTLQLAAWATAWIEVDEGEALDFLGQHYFERPGRREDEMSALLMALSVHGNNGQVHLRDRIADDYRMILDSHPALASGIVADLTAWERWDLAGEVAAIVAAPDSTLGGPARQQLRNYVLRADESSQETPNGESGGGSGHLVLLFGLLALVPVILAVASRAGRKQRANVTQSG